MDTTREGLTGLTKLQPGLPSTWDTGVSGDKGITYTALPQSRDGAMVRFKTRNSSSGRGLLVPSAHLLLYYTSEPFRKLSQRASRRSCWIQGQASLSPRAQRLGFESSISNNRLRVPGTLLGVGARAASSIGNLLSGQVRVRVGQTLTWKFSIVAAFSFCQFLQNGMFIWTLA